MPWSRYCGGSIVWLSTFSRGEDKPGKIERRPSVIVGFMHLNQTAGVQISVLFCTSSVTSGKLYTFLCVSFLTYKTGMICYSFLCSPLPSSLTMFMPCYRRRSGREMKSHYRARETGRSLENIVIQAIYYFRNISLLVGAMILGLDLLGVYGWVLGIHKPLDFQAQFCVIHFVVWRKFTVYKDLVSSGNVPLLPHSIVPGNLASTFLKKSLGGSMRSCWF